MEVYLGGKKQKVVVKGKKVSLIIPTNTQGVALKSKDGFSLMDRNGLILTAKEDK